eukprot:4351973-Alexandrium_andersonii.AAC.1
MQKQLMAAARRCTEDLECQAFFRPCARPSGPGLPRRAGRTGPRAPCPMGWAAGHAGCHLEARRQP